MTNKLLISILLFSCLGGCTKPPDLDAPCREFGKYCPQQPINQDLIK